ncbi:hypothetical protein E4582_03085 [Luteimonas yindakuii]|uniref:Lipoprotein n=1 Tax=Luteimonas yindakuii TaxID=2565782 RepID=A0A4Z1RAT1_9GAMM|nr:hypothetical protein [Luteimonas yindakuii]TKS53858.1 hypothetical protein E4582_03085 [Luteimonas yindakuii]
MKIWIQALAAGVILTGCSAERWAERDAVVACERMLAQVLADSGSAVIPEPQAQAAEGDDGFVVTWPAGSGLRVAGAEGGALREATARCHFGLQGDVEWLELDGERVFDPLTGQDAAREQRRDATGDDATPAGQ